MKSRFIWTQALALLAAPAFAADAPVCLTPCGAISLTSRCEALGRAETRALIVFERRVGWSRPAMCKAVKGWFIRVHPRTDLDRVVCGDAWWLGGQVGCAYGYTWEALKMIEVESDKFSTSAYTHELAHVIDGTITGSFSHCRWTPRKILAALRELTGRRDDKPDEKCD